MVCKVSTKIITLNDNAVHAVHMFKGRLYTFRISCFAIVFASDGKYRYHKVSISIDTAGPVIDKY